MGLIALIRLGRVGVEELGLRELGVEVRGIGRGWECWGGRSGFEGVGG